MTPTGNIAGARRARGILALAVLASITVISPSARAEDVPAATAPAPKAAPVAEKAPAADAEKSNAPAKAAAQAPAAAAPAAPVAAKPAASATPAVATTPAAPVPAAQPNPEAEAVWAAYEKRWSETDDYSAGFRQVIEVPDIGSRVESAGRFYFAKPGLVRWDYVEGPPQTVVGDGTWIWLYQPDLEQVYKIPYAKAFGRGGLVELLAGREGFAGRYSATLERPDASTVRILLKSLLEGGGDLEVTMAADTFDLRAVTAHDAAGSITHMTFAEPRRNKGIEGDRFTFTPPAAVDIISDSEAAF
ncbi:MAG: outer membrane lipoprotein carrier protein LolA [Candidatus Binatia bacterium]